MQPRHFFVQLLGQHVHAHLIGVLVRPKIQLRQRLVGKAVAHHKARMPRRAAQVHQPPFGQHEDPVPVGELVEIHLRFDVQLVHALLFVQPIHLDLVVEVPDVAHNRLVLHLLHVFERDDVGVARARHINVAAPQGIFHRRHFEAFHRRLQRVDRIHLGHNAARAHPTQ